MLFEPPGDAPQRPHGGELTTADLAAALPGAVRERRFLMLFQPITAIGGGAPSGFEALLRWRRLDHGLLAPAAFLSLAETAGHMAELGRLALDMTCAFAARLRAALPLGKAPRIGVNISSTQLAAGDIEEDIINALCRHGLPGGSLVLEIAERTLERAGPAVLEALAHLRARGVLVCADGFGAHDPVLPPMGLSIDGLKIDASLVEGLEASPRRRDAVGRIVDMATRRGLRLVAGGVERRTQLNILRELGCAHCQGYLFAEPLPEAQALALALAHTP